MAGAWYAYNEIDRSDEVSRGVRAYFPAVHKVGLVGRLDVTDTLTLDTAYSFNSPTHGSSIDPTVRASHQLDLTATLAVLEGRGQLQFGVADLFDDTSLPSFEPVGNDPHDTPGRTIFVGMSLQF